MNEPAADNLEAPLSDLYQINRIIADTASDAIITIDEESTMLFINRAAEKIFGYSRTPGTVSDNVDA
jgi:PAS domain-containing protein